LQDRFRLNREIAVLALIRPDKPFAAGCIDHLATGLFHNTSKLHYRFFCCKKLARGIKKVCISWFKVYYLV
jgi:hypothetical protein